MTTKRDAAAKAYDPGSLGWFNSYGETDIEEAFKAGYDARDEEVKRLVECLKDYDAWATANEHELECRADDDCDHCVLMQFREEARKVVREHESMEEK